MPAGSGPQVSQVTAFAMPADTAEHVVCTIPLCYWSAQTLGNYLTYNAYVTGAATGTVTFRVRQGTAVSGTLVGAATVLSTAAAQVNMVSMAFQDASAFALTAQQPGQYCLTAQGSVNSVATLTSAILELETLAPIQ